MKPKELSSTDFPQMKISWPIFGPPNAQECGHVSALF